MFGYQKPNSYDLLQFWPNVSSHSEYAEKIIPLAENNRLKHFQKGEQIRTKNLTYINTSRVKKVFQLGQIVAHRQLQVATGPAMGMKPTYDGPFIIEEIDQKNSTCKIEHLHNGQHRKAHLNHLISINFDPTQNRVHSNFDLDLTDINPSARALLRSQAEQPQVEGTQVSSMLSNKQTALSKSVADLNIPIEGNTNVINTNDDISTSQILTEADNDLITVDLPTPDTDSDPNFGRLNDHEVMPNYPLCYNI